VCGHDFEFRVLFVWFCVFFFFSFFFLGFCFFSLFWCSFPASCPPSFSMANPNGPLPSFVPSVRLVDPYEVPPERAPSEFRLLFLAPSPPQPKRSSVLKPSSTFPFLETRFLPPPLLRPASGLVEKSIQECLTPHANFLLHRFRFPVHLGTDRDDSNRRISVLPPSSPCAPAPSLFPALRVDAERLLCNSPTSQWKLLLSFLAMAARFPSSSLPSPPARN